MARLAGMSLVSAQGAGVDLAGVEAALAAHRTAVENFRDWGLKGSMRADVEARYEAARKAADDAGVVVLDAARALARPAGEIAELIDALVAEAIVGGEYNNEAAVHAARTALDAAIAALQRDAAISRRTAGPESGNGVMAELRRLSEAATGGREAPGHPFREWRASGRYLGTRNHMSYIGEVRDQNGNWSDTEKSTGDAKFIAAAANFVRARISAEDRTSLADGATGGEAA